MRKSQRKEEALGTLMELGIGYSATRIAYQLRISKNSASNLLRRLWKEGLARRKKDKFGMHYWITERGSKRLKHFKRERTKEKIKKKLAFWKK